MSTNHLNHSINCLLMEETKQELKILKNHKAFIDYSQTIDDVYENLEYYNPKKKGRVLIVFDGMRPDIESNKKLSSIEYFTCFYITVLFQIA